MIISELEEDPCVHLAPEYPDPGTFHFDHCPFSNTIFFYDSAHAISGHILSNYDAAEGRQLVAKQWMKQLERF